MADVPAAPGFLRWRYGWWVVLAIVLLAVIVFLDVQPSSTRPDRARVQATAGQAVARPPTPEDDYAFLRFSDPDELRGTGVRMLRVHLDDGTRSGFSSYRSGGAIRNLVFLDAGFGKARWLFRDNRTEIDDIRVICACPGDTDDGPVQAIYLEIGGRDADGDRRIDEGAQRVVPALLRRDGTGFRPLMEPVDDVLEVAPAEDGKSIGVLADTGTSLVYREYATADGALRAERVLVTAHTR